MEFTKFDKFYIDTAFRVSEMSHGIRLKVGAVAVRENNILSYGYNGTPAGQPNECEYKLYEENPNKAYDGFDEYGGYRLVTKDSVLHAEENAILKIAKSTQSSEGATMYITHAPCAKCSRMIATAGFKRLIYKNIYRDTTGIELLADMGVEVLRYE